MNIHLFLIINFIIGFLSDIVLNKLSYYNFMKLNTLRPYFENKTIVEAALYAGITVYVIVGIISIIFKLLNKRYLPSTKREYIIYLLLTFVIGFIADYIIYWIDIFPRLELYYKEVGKGLWGGLAILFSVAISLIMNIIINKFK